MIVITTPAGEIGSQVLESLLDTDEDLPIIARDPPSSRAHALDRLEVVERSQGDATGVDEALASADAAFRYQPTFNGSAERDRREAHTTACERGRTF